MRVPKDSKNPKAPAVIGEGFVFFLTEVSEVKVEVNSWMLSHHGAIVVAERYAHGGR